MEQGTHQAVNTQDQQNIGDFFLRPEPGAFQQEAEMLRQEYTEKYGALTPECCNTTEWLSDPWPWDYTGGVC